ncbi:fec operon regulator FecR [compost metagenome]
MNNRSRTDSALSEAASHWCLRLHEADCSDEERREFQRWYEADPAHAAEYKAMCKVWQLSAQLPPSVPLRTAKRKAHGTGYQLARAACLLLVVGGLWAVGWWAGLLPANVRYYAAQPERREVILPDHSRVELNLRTPMLYLEYVDRRSVLLKGGEAFFSVYHNAQYPFVVRTDNGGVKVTGTQFNIWTVPERTTVTVSEGSVLVSPPPSNSIDQAVQLTRGMQAVLHPGQQLQVGQADLANVTSWRGGKLILDDISLRDALPLLNRYLPHPLRLADDSAAELHIGGIYDTSSLERLVVALPRILPVHLQQRDGAILISSSAP